MAHRPTPSDRKKKLSNVTRKPAAKKSIVHGKNFDIGEMNHEVLPWPHTTGLQTLDKHVMIQPGQFFQIVAAGGGGKTEFCYTMIAEALHHHKDGKVIIIDYTKDCNLLRLKEELMNRFGPISEDKVNEQLRRVISIPIRDFARLIFWLDHFEVIYKDSKIIMVIIENIALFLASTYRSMDYYRIAGERDQILLFSLCQKLFYKFPIIFTNYISGWDATKMKPALGKLYWNKHIPIHILLVRHGIEFHAQVFNMVKMQKYVPASGILKFYLSRRGVTCSKQEAENEPSKWWMYGSHIQEINAPQDIRAEREGSAERYELLFGGANDLADENDEITSKIRQLSIASRFNKIPQPAPSSTKSIERGSLPWEANISQNDVTIVGEKRQKMFCPNGFIYKNVTRYFDNNRYVDYFDEMLDFQSPIILEFLHNFYLNVYNDVALAGVDFFEALNDDFKKPQQILDRLLNYDEHITTRIIGLLEDHTVMTLHLETFDLYHYDPYAPNDSVGREARIQNLEAMIPKIKALFEYHDKIRMVVGYIPNELLQEKVEGNEFFGCCIMELLIKYTNLPNITGLEFENLRKRFQSWCYEVLKFKKNPQWIPFGSPLNYFETVRNVHNGGPVDISVVARYIRQQIQLHSTNQRQIGFFDPAWLKHCDEYPIEIILEKFGQNYSSDTKKLIFLVAIEEHQYLFEYYNHKLICKNSIVSYEDNPEWKKRTDAIRSKIIPILKAIFNDRDYVRYNAKIDKNLVQHQNCPIDSPLFVVKFANLSIENVKHEGQFNPADSRKVLKNAFSLKFIDFRIADAASSNVLGVERYFEMIGFQVHPVLPDGSSFYRAVAVALGRDEDNHRKLRIATNCYLSHHQDDYYQLFDQMSVDEHLQNQIQIDMPVELVDIVVLSDMENKGILLVENGRHPIHINQQMPEQIVLVRTSTMSDYTALRNATNCYLSGICFVHGNHYNALVSIRPKENDSSKSTKKPALPKIIATPKRPSSTAKTPMGSATRQRPRRLPTPPPVEDSSDSSKIDSASNSDVKKDSAPKSKTRKNPKPTTTTTSPDIIDISDDSESFPQPAPKSASKNLAGSKRKTPNTSSTTASFFEKKPQKNPTTPNSSAKKPDKEAPISKNAKAFPVPTLSDDDSIKIDSASDSDVKNDSAPKSKTGKKRKATKKRPVPSKPTKKNHTAKPKASSAIPAINDENAFSMFTENDDDNDSGNNDDSNDDDCSVSEEDDNNDSNNCDDEDYSMHTDDDDSDDDSCCDACWMHKHGHVRDPVPLKIITEAMKWAETNSSEIAASIYSELAPILKNKTVIQIQVYGSGELDFTEKKSGPLQLAIAFNLMNRLKEKFPEISITCQEPRYVESEKEYLRSKGVKVLENEKFSSKHFIQASKAAKNISNAAFICYMIHGMYKMCEEFLEAHWNPDILSRCIFISNNPENGLPFPKRREFGKICDSKPLEFEEESLGEICFGDTCIYSISKENAGRLINRFK